MIIEVTQEPLTEEKQKRIKDWLTAPESLWVEEIVKGQIAARVAEGSNLSMQRPEEMLVARDVAPAMKAEMIAGASLELFLSTLKDLRNQATYSNVSLKIR